MELAEIRRLVTQLNVMVSNPCNLSKLKEICNNTTKYHLSSILENAELVADCLAHHSPQLSKIEKLKLIDLLPIGVNSKIKHMVPMQISNSDSMFDLLRVQRFYPEMFSSKLPYDANDNLKQRMFALMYANFQVESLYNTTIGLIKLCKSYDNNKVGIKMLFKVVIDKMLDTLDREVTFDEIDIIVFGTRLLKISNHDLLHTLVNFPYSNFKEYRYPSYKYCIMLTALLSRCFHNKEFTVKLFNCLDNRLQHSKWIGFQMYYLFVLSGHIPIGEIAKKIEPYLESNMSYYVKTSTPNNYYPVYFGYLQDMLKDAGLENKNIWDKLEYTRFTANHKMIAGFTQTYVAGILKSFGFQIEEEYFYEGMSFDFYIPKYKCLLDINGSSHYEYTYE